MLSTKWEGLSYPPTSKKVGVVLLGIFFFEYRTKQATIFARRNDFYALFATNKAKHILNKHVSCSCSDTIYSKSIKKNRKKVPFLKVYHFSISQHFPNVKGVVVQAVIA